MVLSFDELYQVNLVIAMIWLHYIQTLTTVGFRFASCILWNSFFTALPRLV